MNDFDLNKMLDVGVGIAMTQYMLKTINNRQQEVSQAKEEKDKETEYYVVANGKSVGPYTLNELRKQIENRSVFRETYVWKTGMREWVLAINMKELCGFFDK